jgi:predicted membrane protein
MRKSTIYWGTFLITIGTLLLINKFNTIDTDFTVFISLWPLFLIFWGLSIIHFPEHIRKILTFLSALFLALFIFAIITNGLRITKKHIFHWTQHHSSEMVEYSKKVEHNLGPKVKTADLNINFGVGILQIMPSDDSLFTVDDGYFNLDRNDIPGNDSKIEFNISSTADKHIIDRIDDDDKMKIFLPQYIDWYIDANIGATDADFNLSGLRTPHVKIDCGACDLNIKLGNLCETQELDINCGASDISIFIPKDAGCRIVSDVFLSDIDYEGFINHNDSWQTPNYTNAENKIEINLNGGVSDFNIRRY